MEIIVYDLRRISSRRLEAGEGRLLTFSNLGINRDSRPGQSSLGKC